MWDLLRKPPDTGPRVVSSMADLIYDCSEKTSVSQPKPGCRNETGVTQREKTASKEAIRRNGGLFPGTFLPFYGFPLLVFLLDLSFQVALYAASIAHQRRSDHRAGHPEPASHRQLAGWKGVFDFSHCGFNGGSQVASFFLV